MAVKGGVLLGRSSLLAGRAKQKLGKRSPKPSYMKNLRFIGWLRGTIWAALLLFAIPASRAHRMGGGFHSSGGMGARFHSSDGHNFSFHHDGGHFFHHDGDHFFDRHHDFDHHRHRDFDDRFFLFGFGYPYYGYPYDYYPYDYGYSDYYGAPYNDQYWSDLTAAVQTELARAGYYHGAIDGAVSSDTVRAIRAYRKARGLPVSSQIDRRLLRSLASFCLSGCFSKPQGLV
jgi:Putative peptidoglycan binding domain